MLELVSSDVTFAAKVKRTIAEHDLISAGDSVLVGLSGGPDSVALLRILHGLKRQLAIRLSAVYINHGIRPDAASQEENFCADLCGELAIPLQLVREDIPALARRSKRGLEEVARDFRYRTYEEMVRAGKLDKVALGHHADDQVETVLFRILRGTGVAGLSGIPIRRGPFVRPLLGCTKDEILSYLQDLPQSYCVDESNADLRFKRNYVRHKLLVDVRTNLNPAVDSAILHLAEMSAAENVFLERKVATTAKKAVKVSAGDKIELDLSAISGYDKWLKLRLLRRCVADASGGETLPDFETSRRLLGLASGSGKAVTVSGSLQATRVDDKLVFGSRSSVPFCRELRPNGRCRLEIPRLTLRARVEAGGMERLDRKRSAERVVLDTDKLALPLCVRNIRRGDRFRPLGMKGSKKIGDYLTDRKVPPVYRNEIPVVCDTKGIVWLVGYEIADRVKVDTKTEEVLTIEVHQRRRSRTKTFRATS